MIDTFERGESLSTGQAFAAATNRRALFGDTGVDDLGVVGSTMWTEHIPRVLRDVSVAIAKPRQVGSAMAHELHAELARIKATAPPGRAG